MIKVAVARTILASLFKHEISVQQACAQLRDQAGLVIQTELEDRLSEFYATSLRSELLVGRWPRRLVRFPGRFSIPQQLVSHVTDRRVWFEAVPGQGVVRMRFAPWLEQRANVIQTFSKLSGTSPPFFVTIPAAMRKAASWRFTPSVVLVAVGDAVEIWDPYVLRLHEANSESMHPAPRVFAPIDTTTHALGHLWSLTSIGNSSLRIKRLPPQVLRRLGINKDALYQQLVLVPLPQDRMVALSLEEWRRVVDASAPTGASPQVLEAYYRLMCGRAHAVNLNLGITIPWWIVQLMKLTPGDQLQTYAQGEHGVELRIIRSSETPHVASTPPVEASGGDGTIGPATSRGLLGLNIIPLLLISTLSLAVWGSALAALLGHGAGAVGEAGLMGSLPWLSGAVTRLLAPLGESGLVGLGVVLVIGAVVVNAPKLRQWAGEALGAVRRSPFFARPDSRGSEDLLQMSETERQGSGSSTEEVIRSLKEVSLSP